MVRLAGTRFGLNEPEFTQQLQSTAEQQWLQSGDGPHFGTQSNTRPQPTELGSGYANATSFLNDGNREYDVPQGLESVEGGNPQPFMGDNDRMSTDPPVSVDADQIYYPQDGAPAGAFGPGVRPTDLDIMKHKHILSPHGGVAQLAPTHMRERLMDDEELMLRQMGVPHTDSLEFQKKMIETRNPGLYVPRV